MLHKHLIESKDLVKLYSKIKFKFVMDILKKIIIVIKKIYCKTLKQIIFVQNIFY